METSTVGLTSAAQPFIAADSAVDVTLNLDMTQACEPQCGLVVSAGTAAELLTLGGLRVLWLQTRCVCAIVGRWRFQRYHRASMNCPLMRRSSTSKLFGTAWPPIRSKSRCRIGSESWWASGSLRTGLGARQHVRGGKCGKNSGLRCATFDDEASRTHGRG